MRSPLKAQPEVLVPEGKVESFLKEPELELQKLPENRSSCLSVGDKGTGKEDLCDLGVLGEHKSQKSEEVTIGLKSETSATLCNHGHWGLIGQMPLEAPRLVSVTSDGTEKCSVKLIEPADIGQQTLTLSNPKVLVKERWYLPIMVNSQRGEFLIDTGATTTLVTKEFYDSLCQKPTLVPTNTIVEVADGEPIRTEGLGYFPLQVEGHVFMMPCLVVSGIAGNDDGIIGADFYHVHKCSLNWSGEFSLEKGAIRVMCRARPSTSKAMLGEDVYLEAFRSKLCRLSAHSMPSGDLMFQPDSAELSEFTVGSLKAYVHQEDGATVPLCNPTAMPIRIPKGTVVGEVHQVEVVDEDLIFPETPVPDEPGCPLKKMVQESHIRDNELKREAIELLEKYRTCFSMPGDYLGNTDKVKHAINTGDALPIRQSLRRLPTHRREVAEEEINKMIRKGVIEPSDSSWASPIVMVKKKDGSIRFCVDYRKLNGVTKKDGYPLPRIDESLQSLGGNKWFCSLDLESGYWQIAMDEDSKEKTAFISSLGLFQFKVMSFGLCNAPATFERMMEKMLSGLRWTKCLVYIDDVIVFGKTFQEMLDNLGEVLERIKGYGLKLKPKKCKMFRKKVEYLGRVVSENGIEAHPEKIRSVKDWPTPINAKEIRQFIGFASYYREFLPKFAEVVNPLQSVVNKATKLGRGYTSQITWTPDCEKAFNKVKYMLTHAPVLNYPNSNGMFILDTDASKTGIAGVLSQVQNDKEVVISYASNVMSNTQQNYCTTKRELLAVITYLKKFRHYLLGCDNYVIRTDHASLKWLINFKDPHDMLARWLTTLQEYDVKPGRIIHRPGKQHINADALSRLPTRKCGRSGCIECQKSEPVVSSISVLQKSELIKKAQEQDPDLAKIIRILRKQEQAPEKGALSAESEEFRTMLTLLDELEMDDEGILRLCWIRRSNKRKYWRIVVPFSLREELFRNIHGGKTTGHFGDFKSVWAMKIRYYWPGLKRDIHRWIKACPECNSRKSRQGKGVTPLKKEIHGTRFSRISMDIIGPFGLTPKGNTCVLVITDFFTKWVEAIPLPDHKAETVANALFYEWILKFGPPASIQTDGAPEFRSELLNELCSLMDIEKLLTLPYRPQSNGLVERFNRVLVEQLSCLTDYDSDNWDLLVPCIASAYRSTVQVSTNCTPNSAMFGEEIWNPPDLVFGIPKDGLDFVCPVNYVEHLKKQIRTSHRFIRDNLGLSAVHQKRNFDRKTKVREFKPGELVYRYCPPKANKKIGPKWDGPFEVIRHIGGTTYELKTTQGLVRWHVDYLKSVFNKDGLRQVRNLDKAPEFRKQEEKDLHYLSLDERGRVIPGRDIKLPNSIPKTGFGVKPRGRPKKNKLVSNSDSEKGEKALSEAQPLNKDREVKAKARKKRRGKRTHKKKSKVETGSEKDTSLTDKKLEVVNFPPDRGKGKRKIKVPERYGILNAYGTNHYMMEKK